MVYSGSTFLKTYLPSISKKLDKNHLPCYCICHSIKVLKMSNFEGQSRPTDKQTVFFFQISNLFHLVTFLESDQLLNVIIVSAMVVCQFFYQIMHCNSLFICIFFFSGQYAIFSADYRSSLRMFVKLIIVWRNKIFTIALQMLLIRQRIYVL